MSREGAVLAVTRVMDEGIPIVEVQIDPDGGDNGTPDHYSSPGDDSLPLPGYDYAQTCDAPGTGDENCVGYIDTKNVGKAAPGEKRIYSRKSADGTVAYEVWLKGDGSLLMANANGSFTMAPNGDVTITGNLIVNKEVTAMAASPSTSVTVSKHTHAHPFGTTLVPNPGT